MLQNFKHNSFNISYTLNITPGNNNSVIVASFDANLTSLGGKSATILASGFLTLAANQNGAAFGLLAVLADGTAFLLSNVTGIEENSTTSNLSLFPNPINDQFNLNFELSKSADVTCTIRTIDGKVINSSVYNNLNSGVQKLNFDASAFSAGIYFMELNDGTSSRMIKLVKSE